MWQTRQSRLLSVSLYLCLCLRASLPASVSISVCPLCLCVIQHANKFSLVQCDLRQVVNAFGVRFSYLVSGGVREDGVCRTHPEDTPAAPAWSQWMIQRQLYRQKFRKEELKSHCSPWVKDSKIKKNRISSKLGKRHFMPISK